MATIVEGLKAQGNALHVQGNYRAAYQIYSEAIQENPDGTLLAVLYANRAADCLVVKESIIESLGIEKFILTCDALANLAQAFAYFGSSFVVGPFQPLQSTGAEC